MDPSRQAISDPVLALVGFFCVVVLLLFLAARWKWHVLLALMVPLLLLGLMPGVRRSVFIQAFQEGFGNTLGKIGVVIVLGSIIAEFLKHTGAIQVITRSMVNLAGAHRMPLALTLSGFVLGVAIFSDVAYVILNPLVHSAARVMGVGMGVMSIGLVSAIQLTHAVVPPTPGPLAAAALVGADIGRTIIYGSLACLAGSLAGWVWGQYLVGPRLRTLPSEEFSEDPVSEEEGAGRPGTLRSYAPIAVPVVLISSQSVVRFLLEEGHPARRILEYLGWPVIALSIGLVLAWWNIRSPEDRKSARSVWIEDGLRASAMILVVTGLGGSLSAILKATPAVGVLAEAFAASGLPAILLPFVIGILGNMITGSTTVGVITAASLVAPMLDDLSLSPEAAMLAGACGSVIIKYVNSSYFWVCTSLSGLPVREAIWGYGGGTLVGGGVSFAVVYLLWALGIL